MPRKTIRGSCTAGRLVYKGVIADLKVLAHKLGVDLKLETAKRFLEVELLIQVSGEAPKVDEFHRSLKAAAREEAEADSLLSDRWFGRD